MKIFFIICLIFPFSLRAENRKIPTSCKGSQCVKEPYYIDIRSIEDGKYIYFSIKSPKSEFECKTISVTETENIPPSVVQGIPHSSYSNETDGKGFKSFKFKIKSNSDFYTYIYFTLNANIKTDIEISLDQIGDQNSSIVKYILIAFGGVVLLSCLICFIYYYCKCRQNSESESEPGSGPGPVSDADKLILNIHGKAGNIGVD